MHAWFKLAIWWSIVLGLIGLLAYTVWWQSTHDCARGHSYHVGSGLILVGKVFIPVAAHDEWRCDEWKPK